MFNVFAAPPERTPLLLAALLAGLVAPHAQAQVNRWQGAQNTGEAMRPCLDYWRKGNTGACQVTPSPTKVVAPLQQLITPTGPAVAQASSTTPPTLDQKIDKFLEDFGKPPREFVAFYLDPSPENAMKWVHTYQEILDRPQQLAYSWTQAETLYKQALAQGTPAAAFASTTLAPVQDFGIPVDGFTNPIPSPTLAGLNMPGAVNPLTGLTGGAQLPVNTLGVAAPGVVPAAIGPLSGPALTLGSNATSGSLGGVNAFTSGGLTTTPAADGPLTLTYYYSAICPYCHKFTPELDQVLKNLDVEYTLTCVDITPYTGPGRPMPDESNIKGQLNCSKWRTAEAVEEDRLAIKQTPTLMVQRHPAAAMERISGYVPSEKLAAYLTKR